MCLGIPGQIVRMDPESPDLALVDVAGAERSIHVGLLSDEGLTEGDWILIHVGVAMEKIDEEKARQSLSFLAEYTEDPPDAAGRGWD